MAKSGMRKTTVREIGHSLGRYLAMMAIIALGVGFFSGLKAIKPAMIDMANRYFKEEQLFDLRLLSTLGFQKEDVEAFGSNEQVRAVEGAVSTDALFVNEQGNESVIKVHSLPESINGILLKEGRMPQNTGECVIDANLYSGDQIGQKIRLSENNDEDTLSLFKAGEYTIVGTVYSSYYANFERGNTSLGSGRISGFMYLPGESFDCDYYTEIFVKFEEDLPIYSSEYDDYMEAKKKEWDEICEKQVNDRYEQILSDAQKELADAREELAEQKADVEEQLKDAKTELTDAEKQLEEGNKELAEAKKELEQRQQQLDQKEQELLSKEQELDAGIKAAAQIPDAAAAQQMSAQFAAAKQELQQGKDQIAAGKEQLHDARKKLEEKEQELSEAGEEIAQGFEEYETSYQEFQEQIKDGEEQIEEAQKEIDDIEQPDYYVLGRDTNVGYVCFDSDSQIIDQISNVLPVFFFLVAALVCMTTMNRMVEEQRTQIGILKALGYGEGAVTEKYIFYAGSAAILGCISGFFVGTWLFPKVVWNAYGIMYNMIDVRYLFEPPLFVISLCGALLCSVGVTWISCKSSFTESAAYLMRPKSPKAGKRVFLEHFPLVWRRMKFLHKVSVRNIFRYKKRFFMMVLGISGCTALLVTGFGIRDSVTEIANLQYSRIQIYDMSVSLKDTAFSETAKEQEVLAQAAGEYGYFAEMSMDLQTQDGVKSVNLIVPEKEELGQYVDLHTTAGEPLSLKQDGAVISNKLAERYKLKVGDEILLRSEDAGEGTVRIIGIFENYIYNCVYMNAHTYETAFSKEPQYKTIYVNLKEGQDAHEAAARLMNCEQVSAVMVNADMLERVSGMMDSLNYVVLLIISCAAFLAFIVLYNLTNINITERNREIATLKVLGFFKNETASYVFRENILLTMIGALTGLLLGKYFHIFVMSQINIDMVSFKVQVKPVSYLISVLLTLLFAGIVNLFMSAKLEAIDMAESLKSVD